MPSTHDEILKAALKLPEAERLSIATRLLDTLPADMLDVRDADSEFDDLDELIEEWDRRANDGSEFIPLSDIWKRVRKGD